jgi:hypothetical protein
VAFALTYTLVGGGDTTVRSENKSIPDGRARGPQSRRAFFHRPLVTNPPPGIVLRAQPLG